MQAAIFISSVIVPVVVAVYVLWLLTRLTQTVERIEYRLAQLVADQHQRGSDSDDDQLD